HRCLLKPEDVGEVVGEVLQKRLLGGAGVAEDGCQSQRTQQVIGHVVDSFLVGHLPANPFVWWGVVIASSSGALPLLSWACPAPSLFSATKSRVGRCPSFIDKVLSIRFEW